MIRKVWYLSYTTNYPGQGDNYDTQIADIIRYNEYMDLGSWWYN